MVKKLLLALPLAIACLSGCETDSGYIPHVPGPGFTERLEIDLVLPDTAPVAAGEWVTMHATRESGPWVLWDSTMTEEPECEEISPVIKESEVASKVEWRVEPSEGVSFNTPAPPTYERQMRFEQPGRYRVWAVSVGCAAPYESNQVDVVVR